MFVPCVHPVAVVNAALYMSCSLLMLVEDARGVFRELCPVSFFVAEESPSVLL